MQLTIQFRMNADEEELALRVLQRTSARNLNQLAKRIFMGYLTKEATGQAEQLDNISEKITELYKKQVEMVELLDANDPTMFMRLLSAVYFLNYKSAGKTSQIEIDKMINTDFVFDYLGRKNG